MRPLFFSVGFLLCASTCFGQSDSMRKAPTTIAPVVTPSNSVPLTSPAAVPETQPLQPEKTLTPKKGKRRLKTVPPSEPNALGVGVTLDKKEEKPTGDKKQ